MFKRRLFKAAGPFSICCSFCFLGVANCDSASEYQSSSKIEQSKAHFPDHAVDAENKIYTDMKEKFYESCAGETSFLIGVSELEQIISTAPKSVVLLDQRETEEQQVSRIPGAIPYQSFDVSSARKDVEYVVYCTIGCRSGALTEKLRSEGLNARNLVGGVLAWSWLNQNFEDSNSQSTKKVHVYSKNWNFLNPSYEAVH